MDQAAHLAAWNDYPDEDMESVTPEPLAAALRSSLRECQALLDGYDTGRILREGVDTAIIGRPNVGKSTLMNLLAGTQKSIVTAIPGTTRDVVEETVLAGEIVLRLADTAGIRDTDDPVEQAGVQLARRRLESAQLVLVVLDRSEPLSEGDQALLASLAGAGPPLPCSTNPTCRPNWKKRRWRALSAKRWRFPPVPEKGLRI